MSKNIKIGSKTFNDVKYISCKSADDDSVRYNFKDVDESITSKIIDRTITELSEEDLAGITSIGAYAFAMAESLISVAIPNGITAIKDRAFFTCINLTSVTIPNSVEYIKTEVFFQCDALNSVTIPASIISIGSKAFNKTDFATQKATYTLLSQTPPAIQSSNIFKSSLTEKIIVPSGCGDAYKAATNWSVYADLIEEAT